MLWTLWVIALEQSSWGPVHKASQKALGCSLQTRLGFFFKKKMWYHTETLLYLLTTFDFLNVLILLGNWTKTFLLDSFPPMLHKVSTHYSQKDAIIKLEIKVPLKHCLLSFAISSSWQFLRFLEWKRKPIYYLVGWQNNVCLLWKVC